MNNILDHVENKIKFQDIELELEKNYKESAALIKSDSGYTLHKLMVDYFRNKGNLHDESIYTLIQFIDYTFKCNNSKNFYINGFAHITELVDVSVKEKYNDLNIFLINYYKQLCDDDPHNLLAILKRFNHKIGIVYINETKINIELVPLYISFIEFILQENNIFKPSTNISNNELFLNNIDIIDNNMLFEFLYNILNNSKEIFFECINLGYINKLLENFNINQIHGLYTKYFGLFDEYTEEIFNSYLEIKQYKFQFIIDNIQNEEKIKVS